MAHTSCIPIPLGPGGKGDAEDWVWDNFGFDPFAKNSMVQTAENVAKEAGITTAEQNEMMLLRYNQYQDALKDDAAFHKRYMVTPLEVKDASGRKVVATVKDDEGVFPTTAEGLAKLKPVLDGGTVTFGGQTFPADGNCGMIVTTREKARELSRDPHLEIQVLAFGQGRAKKGYMAQAIVPASRQALDLAGLSIGDMKAIKTHNPFAVNDVYFCREMGVSERGDEQLWLVAHLGTPARADRHEADDRADRGTRVARRRVWAVRRLRGGRHGGRRCAQGRLRRSASEIFAPPDRRTRKL